MKQILLFLILFLACNPLYAFLADEVKIDHRAIILPLNRFLLIQRGDYLGAVVFISHEQNKQGDFTRYRNYKYSPEGWREEKEDTIGFRSLTWVQRVLGKLGIHTPPLSREKPLELKGMTLLAHPTMSGEKIVVYYGVSVDNQDPTIKLAPTPWRTIQEVDLRDARLKWYSSGSPKLEAKIDELWK
jgi:hypothetical protein